MGGESWACPGDNSVPYSRLLRTGCDEISMSWVVFKARGVRFRVMGGGGSSRGKASWTDLSSSSQGPQAASSPPGIWASAVLLISITPTLPRLEDSFLRRRSLTLAPTALPRFLRCWLLPTLSPGPPGSPEPGVMVPGAPGLDRWGKEWLDWSFGVRVVFKFSNMLWSTVREKGSKAGGKQIRKRHIYVVSNHFWRGISCLHHQQQLMKKTATQGHGETLESQVPMNSPISKSKQAYDFKTTERHCCSLSNFLPDILGPFYKTFIFLLGHRDTSKSLGSCANSSHLYSFHM